MSDSWVELPSRLATVRQTIAGAAARCGRDGGDVQIVAVTKTHPPSAVDAAVGAGVANVGENYVQEARAKRDATRSAATWHLIGGLQRNKVRVAVATFDWIHSIDSVALATAVAAAAARPIRALVQVNASDGADRRGVLPSGARAVAEALLAGAHLVLAGVMVIAPAGGPPEAARPAFRMAREVRDDLAKGLGVELPHLSMGMSDDFAVAVEEGATLLRLGRVLFGSREAGSWQEGS